MGSQRVGCGWACHRDPVKSASSLLFWRYGWLSCSLLGGWTPKLLKSCDLVLSKVSSRTSKLYPTGPWELTFYCRWVTQPQQHPTRCRQPIRSFSGLISTWLNHMANCTSQPVSASVRQNERAGEHPVSLWHFWAFAERTGWLSPVLRVWLCH